MTPSEAHQFAKALALANRHPDPEAFAQEVASHFTAPVQAQDPTPSPSAPTEPETPHSWESAQS